MQVEFFSAECKSFERTANILHHTFPNLEMTVHNAAECVDGHCCELAEKFGVRAVPSLVVDGEVVLVRLPDADDLKRLESAFSERQ